MGTISKEVVGAGKAFTSVFRSPSLRRISLAFAASVIGDWAYAVAVSVWAFGQGGATAVGLFGVARYVSMAVLGPLLSTLADRFPRRRVMIGADLVRMVLVVLGAVAIATDGPAVIVYSIGLLTAVASLVFRPAQAALLPQLTRTPSELTSTNVAMSTIESVGFFAGPAIGGVLLAVADVEVVYLVNAVSFLVSALLIAGMGVPSSDAAAPIGDDDVDRGDEPVDAEVVDGRTERFVSEALAGFRTIARNRDLRLIAVLMTAQTVVAGASLVFEVSIAFDLLDLGESGVGVLSAMLGIGGIVGGFVALVLARRERLAGDFGVGVLLWSAPLLLIVVWPTLGATIAAMMVIGVANSIVDINAYTIVQRVAPAEVMGRVFGALESAFTAGMALGALAMPLLIETVGLRTGLAVIGTVVAVMALAGQPALRRIDTTVLAPPGLALARNVPMLGVLPPPVLERIAHQLVTVTVPAGTVVFREGDPGDRFWIIQRGTAIVSIGGVDRRELGPGDSFGEIAVLRDVPRTATVCAGDEALVLAGLDRNDFLTAVTGSGESREVADALVDRWLALG